MRQARDQHENPARSTASPGVSRRRKLSSNSKETVAPSLLQRVRVRYGPFKRRLRSAELRIRLAGKFQMPLWFIGNLAD